MSRAKAARSLRNSRDEPALLRRPDQIVDLLDGDDQNLVYRGGDGKLYLTPLQPKDARRHALEVLRQFFSLLTFRREVAPGEEDGRAFRVPLADIHLAQPTDNGGAGANLPSIVFRGGPDGTTDTLGIGGVQLLEDTYGVDGPGTAVGRYGEWVETFTIEVVAESDSKRQGIVAGLKQVFGILTAWNTLRLRIDEFFGVVANFELESVQYFDEPFAAQNRFRAELRSTLTVPELFVVRGLPLFKPQVLIEVGTDVVIVKPSIDDQT